MNITGRKVLGGLLLASAMLTLPFTSAQAATQAANTQIINTATLNYNDGGTNKTSTASAVVLYAVVPSAPTIVTGSTPAATPYSPGASTNNSFTLINKSNGKDIFNLETIITAQTNTSGAAATVSSPSSPVTLGGTITSALGTTTRMVVPFDGSASATSNSINGLVAGKMIAINGNTGYTIGSVHNANDAGGSWIDITTPYTGNIASGVQIGEYVTVIVNVTPGTIDPLHKTTDVTVSKALKATSTINSSATTTSSPITDTFTSGSATLLKYVRNLNGTPGDATGVTTTYNSTTYYQRGVPAGPNDKLEYLLVANNQGAITVSGASINDVLPVSFVTLLTGVYSGANITYVNEAGVPSYLSSGYTYNSGSGDLSLNIGTISPAKSVSYLYQVQVKP